MPSVPRFAVVFAGLLVVGLASVGAAAGVAAASRETPTAPGELDSAGAGDATEGFTGDRVGIADPATGELAGYITGEQDRSGVERGFPALDLGTGAVEVTGVPVVDEAGEQVGYFLTYVGFIDDATAADPEAVDRIVQADRDARERYADDLAELSAQLDQGAPR